MSGQYHLSVYIDPNTVSCEQEAEVRAYLLLQTRAVQEQWRTFHFGFGRDEVLGHWHGWAWK
jgi:hypothetical protein